MAGKCLNITRAALQTSTETFSSEEICPWNILFSTVKFWQATSQYSIET